MRIYVGITGLSGTGKNTVGNILTDLAEANSIQVYRYNLSDEIRDELTRRGAVGDLASRATLIEVGNELRASYGGGVLAERIVARDLGVCQIEDHGSSLVIVTGIRNPDEVKTFRRKWGTRFILLAVQVSQGVRAVRIASRRQYKEDTNLSGEVDQADKAIGILACEEMSDLYIRNDGSIEELHTVIRTLFERKLISTLDNGNTVF